MGILVNNEITSKEAKIFKTSQFNLLSQMKTVFSAEIPPECYRG